MQSLNNRLIKWVREDGRRTSGSETSTDPLESKMTRAGGGADSHQDLLANSVSQFRPESGHCCDHALDLGAATTSNLCTRELDLRLHPRPVELSSMDVLANSPWSRH